MPVHNWKNAPSGLFHHFHQDWSISLCRRLNAGVLPKGYFALVEQRAGGLEPDVLALETKSPASGGDDKGGVAVADAPPKVKFHSRADDEDIYAAKANEIAIRSAHGKIVAMIEILSPGNKSSKHNLRAFVEKTLEFLRQGINVLVIDLFAPSRRDPQGIHPLIWDEIREEPFALPSDKPFTLASYVAGAPKSTWVEWIGVGERLPDMPVFLNSARYVPVPLEETYATTWALCPQEFKDAVVQRDA